MRFEIPVGVCALVLGLGAGCSDSGADSSPMFGTTPAGGPAPATDPMSNNGPADPVQMPPGDGARPPVGPGPTPAMPMPSEMEPVPADPADPGSEPQAPGTDPMNMNPDEVMPAPPVQDCSALPGAPGRTVEMIDNAGVSRRYILYVPSSYTGEQPVPLMVNFHPLLTDGAVAESSSGFKALADREGFIVAFPYGQESAAWNAGPCCTTSRDVDDVGFARALVAKVQSEYCVDAKRVYASGFSMGGGMTHYLACEAADVFAAVATGAFDLFEENTCAPARPITVISFRSMSDAIVPYAGGVKQSAPNGFRGTHTFLGAVGTFERWAEIDGCTGQPVDEAGGCKTYNQCSDGVEVTLCTVAGGHTWPDATRAWQTVSRFSLP